MAQKRRDNLEDIILSIFEEDDEIVYPITSDRDTRRFLILLQRKGIDNYRLSQEIDEPETEISSWLKSHKRCALGRKVARVINQPLEDYLLLESELEYANSFIYVDELDVDGVDGSSLIYNGEDNFVASSAESGQRVVGRPRSLLRGVKKRKCKRIPISDANVELEEGQSKSHEANVEQLKNDTSEHSASLDEESEFNLTHSKCGLDVASVTRMEEHCSQNNQEADDGLAMSEADHIDCNASVSSQPDWDDICDRFLLADESSLYEDIQAVPSAIDQESAWSLTDSDRPKEDSEATMSELLYTPHDVEYNESVLAGARNDGKETVFKATMQNSSERVEFDIAFGGIELCSNVDGRSRDDSETIEGGKQRESMQRPNTLIGQSIFETQEGGIGFQPKVGEMRESSSTGFATFRSQDLCEDDGLLVVPTTPGDKESNKHEAAEVKLSDTQTNRGPSMPTATKDSNMTAMTNSITDSEDAMEVVVPPIATTSSKFELKNQSILNESGAEKSDDGDSPKCVSVAGECSSRYVGRELLGKCSESEGMFEQAASAYHSAKFANFEHPISSPTFTSDNHSDGFSTDEGPVASQEVESLASVSSISPGTRGSISVLEERENIESIQSVSEEITVQKQDPIHSADSSPVQGLVQSESSLSVQDASELERPAKAESLPLCTPQPYPESSLFQDSEQFQEFLEIKPFSETSLLEEIENFAPFSLSDRSKHSPEADVEEDGNRSEMMSQPSSITVDIDPENDKKTSIGGFRSSEETSQEKPGFIYVFTDGCSSSKVQRFKVGAVGCPYEELQRARMFNVDIKLVSATAHSSPDLVFQQIKSRLEEWKMEGKEDWFLCSSTIILQTITEVVNTHL